MQLSTQNVHSAPLGKAAEMGHIRTVERLLEGGANINYQDKVRSTCYAKDVDYIV